MGMGACDPFRPAGIAASVGTPICEVNPTPFGVRGPCNLAAADPTVSPTAPEAEAQTARLVYEVALSMRTPESLPRPKGTPSELCLGLSTSPLPGITERVASPGDERKVTHRSPARGWT
jgi:hypothetical protein